MRTRLNYSGHISQSCPCTRVRPAEVGCLQTWHFLSQLPFASVLFPTLTCFKCLWSLLAEGQIFFFFASINFLRGWHSYSTWTTADVASECHLVGWHGILRVAGMEARANVRTDSVPNTAILQASCHSWMEASCPGSQGWRPTGGLWGFSTKCRRGKDRTAKDSGMAKARKQPEGNWIIQFFWALIRFQDCLLARLQPHTLPAGWASECSFSPPSCVTLPTWRLMRLQAHGMGQVWRWGLARSG